MKYRFCQVWDRDTLGKGCGTIQIYFEIVLQVIKSVIKWIFCYPEVL